MAFNTIMCGAILNPNEADFKRNRPDVRRIVNCICQSLFANINYASAIHACMALFKQAQ